MQSGPLVGGGAHGSMDSGGELSTAQGDGVGLLHGVRAHGARTGVL